MHWYLTASMARSEYSVHSGSWLLTIGQRYHHCAIQILSCTRTMVYFYYSKKALLQSFSHRSTQS
ncbi:hypothetical protein BDQ17DRAFT_1371432 [Cyathus striatus]|nr:hypothetical protein BDQ17DRAFT_1371432 [Cyathus striatus]